MIHWIRIILLIMIGLVGCDKRPPIVRDYQKWWDALSSEQQESILRASVSGDLSKYKLTLQDNEQELVDLKSFVDWVNNLSPAEIEAYEFHRLVSTRSVPHDVGGDVVVRGPTCIGGLWVQSTHCRPGPDVAQVFGTNKCLRCVPGIKETK